MPGFVSWVLGIVCWVLGIFCWVSGFAFWVSGFVFWVLGFVFWVLGLVFWVLGFVFGVLGLVFGCRHVEIHFEEAGLRSKWRSAPVATTTKLWKEYAAPAGLHRISYPASKCARL